MFYVLQNESTAGLRRVPILLTDAATGTTAQTGVALGDIYPYVNINGGSFSSGAGSVAEAGYGQYYYEFDAGEIATLGLAGIHITAAGCRDYDAIVQVAAFNMYGVGSGISAGDVWTYDISAITAAGSAGTQLNLAASGGGAGISAADVWNYQGPTEPASVKETLESANTNAANAYSSIAYVPDQVWNTDVSSFTSPSAGYDLTQAASGGAGITAGDVWNFEITGFGDTGSAAVYTTQTNFTVGNIETYVSNQTPQDVWTYAGIEGRTITGGTADTVTSVTNPVLVDTVSMTGIAGTVWSTDVSGYTSPSAGYDLTQAASGGAGISAYDVWNYTLGSSLSADATITQIDSNVSVLPANTASSVWSYILGNAVDADTNLVNAAAGAGLTSGDVTVAVWEADPAFYNNNSTFGKAILRSDNSNITGSVTVWSGGSATGVFADTYRIDEDYNAAIALKDILTGIGSSITGNITGDLSGSVGYIVDDVTLSAGTQASIANSVWSTDVSGYTSPSAGYDLTQASAGGGGITAGDIWNYDLSSYTPLGISAGSYLFFNTDTIFNNLDIASSSIGSSVWSYAGRTITGGIADTVTNPVEIKTSSMTGIAGTVWSNATRTITGGTITTVSDKTGYSLSNTQSFNLTGNITGNLSGSVGSVTNSVSVSTASMTGIAGTVWNTNISSYTDPSAGYSLQIAGAGAGYTVGDIWNYDISGISSSGSAGNQLNDAAVSGSVVTIVNGPYRLTSTAEGVDGRIDILQNSVQTINLALINGFEQPFNITGYSVSVDVYDIASQLVESYNPTINFASGGNISFDIDTTVTSVIGTYSVVVALTDGDVIKIGPITLLVRPL